LLGNLNRENKKEQVDNSNPDVEARVIPPNSFINGDCMEFMRTCPPNYFDLAIVDPPYGLEIDVHQSKLANRKGFTKNAGTYKEYHKTNWDTSTPPPEYFEQLFRVSKNQIIWGGNYFHDVKLEGIIIWHKKGSGNFKEGELAKTSFNTFKIYPYSRADAYINDCDIKIHPTQKPVKLYKWLLSEYAAAGDLILDTHVGSASSLIACVELGFNYVGFEIDKEYYTMAKSRLGRATRKYELFEV